MARLSEASFQTGIPDAGEIAILIFTRTPAGCKSYKGIGRSSDLFRFYAFPALRPVAKIVKPFAPHVRGRNSQQRVLSQILTAFPFHSSSRNRRFGNLCDGKYTNFCLLNIFDTKKCNPVFWAFYSYESYLSDLRFLRIITFFSIALHLGVAHTLCAP